MRQQRPGGGSFDGQRTTQPSWLQPRRRRRRERRSIAHSRGVPPRAPFFAAEGRASPPQHGCTPLLSLEKPSRPGPWRKRAWPTWLENLQHALDERSRQRIPESSRRQLFLPQTQVYRTPIQNVTAAARIAESIQPSQSEAGRGLMQIRALLRVAGEQNTAISKSQNRIHSRSVVADTVQSAHGLRSPSRREGRGHRQD